LSYGENPVSRHVDVIGAEGALEPDRRSVVEQLTTLLDRTRWCLPRLVHDLDEPGRPVLLELPTEHRAIERLGGIDVVGVDGEVGQSWGHGRHRGRSDLGQAFDEAWTIDLREALATCTV